MPEDHVYMWTIVVTPPDGPDYAIGPFHTEDEAMAWEDKHLDAPEGSRADFIRLHDPADTITDGATD